MTSIQIRDVGNKPFVWSFSLMKGFHACPEKTYKTKVTKEFTESFGSQFDEGNRLHDEIAKYVHSRFNPKLPCPDTAKDMLGMLVLNGFSVLAELSIGVTPELTACGFFGDRVWGRGKLDILATCDDHGIIIDWKSGSFKRVDERWELQSRVFAFLAFIRDPSLVSVTCCTVYLDDGHITDPEEFIRADFDALAGEMVDTYEEMVDNLGSGAVNPGYQCRWCPVTTCSYHPGS